METSDYVERMKELMGPDSWQQHSSTPETIPRSTMVVDKPPDEDTHSTLEWPNKPSGTFAANSSTSWPETGLAEGERCSEGAVFCPWKLVKSYPYTYVGKTTAQWVKPFFNNPSIHRYNPWDLYYIYDPAGSKDRCILFVPTYQLEHMLNGLNAELGTELKIPTQQKTWDKFNITFGTGGSPVPRFLGRSTCYEELEALQKNNPPYNSEDDLTRISTTAQQEFVDLLAQVRISSSRDAKNSKKSEKKRVKRIQDRRSWGKSVKRVQRYLGIRRRVTDLPALEKLSMAETRAPVSTIDISAVGKPEGEVIFVAIDLEAFEFNQKLITEIGVGVFDTRDINKRPPGDKGKDWFPLIRGYHYRIKENTWATNRVHVGGNADRFSFGITEFVAYRRVKKLVTDIVENPECLMSNGNQPKFSMRPVVLVFHDSASDIKFLQALKYDVAEAKNVLEIVDTRDMYQHGAAANQPPGLERVLTELNIPYRYLHNAGNDAVYTLQAMISLAFRSRHESLERDRVSRRNGVTVPGKKQDDEGWATGGEDSDGGKPGEKAPPLPYPGMHYLQGKAFQVGQDAVRHPASSSLNTSSNKEDELADAEHLWW